MNKRSLLWLVAGIVLTSAVLASRSARTAGPPVSRKYPDAKAHRPTPLPDRLVLTWKADPATSQAVTWRTDPSVKQAFAEVAVAEDGPDFAGYQKKQKSKARRQSAQTTELKTDLGVSHYHSANFEGLTPQTLYVYRVGDGVNWSEWLHFRTASQERKPFTFLYFGDAQNDIKAHWSRVIRQAALTAPEARFFVHAGDLINRPNTDAEWGEWFNAGGWLNGTIPSVPTPGNHEWFNANAGKGKKGMGKPKEDVEGKGLPANYKGEIDRHWRPQFTLPEHGPKGQEELVYTFDYQGVRFVSLNSNRTLPKSTKDWEEQGKWLEGVLKDNPCKWTILTFHHPIYSPAKKRDNPELRELWQPIFDRHGVDVVLQGHDHTYARSGLMTGENTLSGGQVRPNGGVVYCVSVSGPKMYELNPQEWMVSSAENKQLFQTIRVDGDRLRYQAHTATGELYDVFELRKRADGSKTLLERKELEAAPAKPAEEKRTRDRSAWLLPAGGVVALLGMVLAWRSFRRV